MAVADVRWAQPCLLAAALLLAAANGQTPGGEYRLPGEVTPEHYDLKIVPFLETGKFRFSGSVDITVTAVKNTENITLHAHEELDVTAATVTEIHNQTQVGVRRIASRKPYQWCIVMLNSSLNIGSKYLLSLQFNGPLKKDNHGFYLSSYAVDGGFEHMATTHFEATSARKAFPCFDEPSFRTTFDISVAKLDDQIALSNMPVESTSDYDPDQGNRRWVKFQTTPKMPTYLVAFIVSKLQKVPTANENINIYVRRNAVDGVAKAVEVAPKLLTALESFLGVAYPLPKLDLVSIPDFPAGAMENWGLVTFKEDMLLVAKNLSTADRTPTSLRVIAHEFAHLWFGDLVTLKWWNTIWQQEGMAALLESYILDKATDGDYGAMSRLGTTRVQTALDEDSREHSVPLTKNDIDTPASIEDHFGTITYSKGCNVHFMLMHVLGEAAYRSGLHGYLTSNAYTSTDMTDFAKALQKAVDDGGRRLPRNVTVQQLVNSWGDQIGYPVLTVHRDYQQNSFTVSQARFLSHKPADPHAADTKWLVPYAISSLYSKADTFTQVLPDDGSEDTVTNDMLSPTIFAYVNRAQAGFYRVNYDMHNWMLLANHASSLEPATRASLIDDLFALNRAGLVDTWLPFFYLEKTLADKSNRGERDIAPWLTAAKVIRGYAALTRADKELATYFQMYIAEMLTTAFEDVGFESEYDYQRYERSVVRDVLTQLACEAGMAECRRKALAASKTIIFQDGKLNSDPNVFAATLCESAKTFDALSLEEALSRITNVEDVTMRASLLRGVGCVRDSDQVTMILDFATAADSGLSSSEVLAALRALMDNSVDGCDTALSYVHTNNATIKANLGVETLRSIVLEIGKRIYNDAQLTKLQDIASGDNSDAMVDVLAVAKATRDWALSNLRELKEWVWARVRVGPAHAPLLVPPSTGPTVGPPTAEPHPTEPPQVTNDWLLPADLWPDNYKLAVEVTLADEDTSSFSGAVDITLSVFAATDKIVLHSHENLTIGSVKVVQADNSAPVAVNGSAAFEAKRQFLTINLQDTLRVDSKYIVSLAFSGPLKKDLAGLYLSTYDVNGVPSYMAVTQFEQTSARKAFPCFDEPKYRATFDVSITHPDTHGALSNMPRVSDKPNGKNKMTAIFATTPVMPTYLVVMLVSDLVQVKVDNRISIWVRADAQDEVGLAKALAPKVLAKLEALTGIPYVLPKLDLAAIPDFAPGAMENWGLITFKDTVLRTPKNALAHRRFNCARDITHEFSHLWFGDLVTNNWWSSLWQQEGMASFMEAWVLDQVTDSEYEAVARQSVDRIEQGLMDDALETAGAITNHTVGSPEEIEEHAGELTYNKGVGFLRMVKAMIGESTMWKGLRKYLQRHAFSTAGPDDLAAALQEAAGEDGVALPVTIQEVMDSWTLQRGYPLLDVERYLNDDTYVVKQSRFLSYEPVNATAVAEQQWLVPYHCEQLYSSGRRSFDSVLQGKQETVVLPLKAVSGITWIVCNTEQQGFYRVNYDQATWRYLGDALAKGLIGSATQRGAILDDALTLMRARKTEPWVVLYVLQRAAGDDTLPVWGAIDKGVQHLRAVLADDATASADLNTFVSDLTAETFGRVHWYNRFGWEETVQTNEVRQIVSRLACDAGEPLCVNSAEAESMASIQPGYQIKPESYGAQNCIQYKNYQSFSIGFLLNSFRDNTDYDQRLSLSYSLGCIVDSDSRDIILAGVHQDFFHSNEVTPFFESLLTHGGIVEALKYLSQNWAAVKAKLSGTAVALLQMAAERVHTEEQYELVKKLSDSDPSIYTTVAERSAANSLAFAQKELGQVKDYLAAYAGRKPDKPAPLVPTDYRLPGNVIPTSYNLTMIPYMDPRSGPDFYFEGSVTIAATVQSDTDTIVLHKHKGINMVTYSVNAAADGAEFGVADTLYHEASEMYTLLLTRPVTAGQQIVIGMEFSGKLLKDKLGFYLSDYPEGVKWKYMATTQFEQTYARKAFPCFDEPKYRAAFTIHIGRTEDQIALSNMPISSTTEPSPDLGNRRMVTFETTPPMPTYLVAFIVSELQKVPTSNPNINVYVRPEAEKHAALAADLAPKILAELERFTGVPYALPKLDLVAIPDFYFGAMENWGLITYRENRLLYDEKRATSEYKMFVAEVIAHEFVHLWFGDYVTLDWWSSGWLKEGFAEFLEHYVLERVMKSEGSSWYPLSRIGVEDIFDGMRDDALEHTEPLTDNTVATQQQISEHMGLYTYTKGAGLHFMLMGLLGEETYRAGLYNYLTTNKYGTATPEKYATALQRAADADYARLPSGTTLLDIINSWSTKPGLPVVTLIRNYDDNTVEASQSRYLAHKPSKESARLSKWIVPLSIFFNQGSPPRRATGFLLESQDSASFFLGGTARNGVIYGNWLSRGYYYTNYDLLNWIRLGSALSDGFTLTDPIYRAGLIHDAFGLARVNQVDAWVPLFLLEADLEQEADAAPWIAAYNGLRSYAALVKGDPATDRMFQRYLRDTVAKTGYNFVGWDSFGSIVDGNVERDYATKLACAVGVADCRANALQAYNNYVKDPESVDPNVLAASLCEGFSLATTLQYTALFEQFMAETERSRRMTIVYALGCLRNTTLVDQVLRLAGTKQGFESQEVLPLFRSVMDNSPDGVDRAVDYVLENFDNLAASLGQSSAESVVLTVAEKVYSETHYTKLSALRDESYSLKLVDAVAVAEANLQWIRANAPTLKDYLVAKLGMAPAAPPARPAVPIPLPTDAPATPTPGPGPTEAPDSPANEWRLPSSVAPQHYDLMMVPFLDNLTFTGKVTIKVLALEQTDTITLHARDLNFPNMTDEGFDNMRVHNAETADVVPVQNYGVHSEKDFLVINLGTNLTANAAYNISIQFGAPLRQDNFGFYVSSYVEENEFKYMATTHFEATSARKAFPCFDEPRFRATFAISVARLAGQTALSNMPRIRTSGPDLDLGGRVWDDFQTTPSMPTYLVAFIVHELQQVRTSASNVNVWVRPNAAADAGVAAEIAPQVIQAMGNFTAFKLPLPKVDLIAIPTFPIGAMENWGLVTFREDYIINPKKAKSEHAFSCASVVTHELSHLWFGDLVTIDWWSAAWLKEGMASFLELYMLDKAADNAKYAGYQRILYEHVQPAMMVDSREGADILTNTTVGSPAEISDHMSTITYSKGGSFLRMMLTYMTENAFKAGLSRYINQNAYYWGTPENLADALQYAQDNMNPNALDVSVPDMFDSWTTKPGFPVVTVIRDRENGIATLSQRRFFSHEPTESADTESTWHVPYNVWVQGQDMPVGYTDVLEESQTQKTILLDDTDFKLVLINAGQTGFYRVNYDLLTWIYVNLGLPRGEISSAEHRAALIDDSFTLALARQLDSWVPLSVMQSGLPSERHLVPWITARNALFRLRALLSQNDEAVRLLDAFVSEQLVTPAYTAVDWDMRWPGAEVYNVKLLRDVLTQVACTSGHALCLRSAAFDFEGWYLETLTVNPDTLAAALCEGMRTMTVGSFPVIWSRYLEEEDPTVRTAYLYGFGCHSSNRQHLLLAATTHNGIKSNEAKHFFNSFLTHMKDGVELLLDYVNKNYDSIKKSVGVEATAAVLQLVADRISSQSQLDMITALVAKDPCIEMTVVLQSAKSTLKWVDEQLGLVVDFLQAADGDQPPPPTPSPAPTRPTLPTLAPPTNTSRLPKDVVPDDYTLKVIPYLSGDKMGTFEGQVTIRFHAVEQTNKMNLHFEGLSFSDDDVTITLGNQSVLINYISRSALYEWMEIALDEDMIDGATYSITVNYTGKFSDELKGFFLSTDGGSTVAATKLAPTYARRLFPCFDEPSLRATFTLTVGRLDNEMVLSNTAVESTSSPDPAIGNRVLVTFKKTPKLATHSVTIVVSTDLKSANAPGNMVTVYGTAKLVAKAQPTLAAAKDLLAVLENITGTPSGLDSLALVGVKDLLVDGTDNWAIDVIRNDALVKMDESPSAAEADILWLTTLAHRLSQHWFGNLVSMKWWNNVWLTDGFATYFQYRAASQIKAADMLYPHTFASRVISPALAEDSLESSPALHNHHVYGTTAGIEDALNDIPTLKGGAIINSIPYILGSAAFESGLKAYMDANKQSGVCPAALFAAMQSSVDTHSTLPPGASVRTVLEPWVDRPGYPVVTVSRDYEADTASLAQQRFLLHTPSGDADMDAAWWVPVSLATRNVYSDEYTTTPIRGWMQPSANLTVNLPAQSASQWLVVNLDRKGYYRVNYDMRNWLLLARFMAEPGQHTVLQVPTRVMLLDDALTLARAGHLDYVTALQYADYLRTEDATHEVFATARNVFASNIETFVLGSSVDHVYKAWVGQLLSSAIVNLGYEARAADNTRTRVARGIVMEWACDMGILSCTGPAMVHFNLWLNEKDSVPHDTLASTVCAGVMNSSAGVYEQAVAALSQETVDPYRQAIIRGLGCVSNHTVAESLMQLTTKAGLRGGEALEVFKSVSRFGPPSVDAALDFLVHNVIAVYKRSGLSGTEAIVSLVASRITTEPQNEKLHTIIAHMGAQQVLEFNVAQLLVDDNLRWHSAHLHEVGDMLYALTGLPNPDLPDGPTTPAAPTTPPTRAPTQTPTQTPTRPTTKPTARPTPPPTRPPPSTAQPTTSTKKPNAASGLVANAVLLLASLVALQRLAA